MHPPLTLHKHPMCAEIIELFQKCHVEHPVGKFFGECTDLKIKLDRCFRQEKALKRKANFEESKKFKEQLRAFRKEKCCKWQSIEHITWHQVGMIHILPLSKEEEYMVIWCIKYCLLAVLMNQFVCSSIISPLTMSITSCLDST